MATFYTVKTTPKWTPIRITVGQVYNFVGKSAEGRAAAGQCPFMVVRVFGNGSIHFAEGNHADHDEEYGWVPLDGPDAGTIYRFGDVEEVELVETTRTYAEYE